MGCGGGRLSPKGTIQGVGCPLASKPPCPTVLTLHLHSTPVPPLPHPIPTPHHPRAHPLISQQSCPNPYHRNMGLGCPPLLLLPLQSLQLPQPEGSPSKASAVPWQQHSHFGGKAVRGSAGTRNSTSPTSTSIWEGKGRGRAAPGRHNPGEGHTQWGQPGKTSSPGSSIPEAGSPQEPPTLQVCAYLCVCLSGGLSVCLSGSCGLILGRTPWGCPKVQSQQHHPVLRTGEWDPCSAPCLPPTQPRDSPLVLPGAGGTAHPLSCTRMPQEGSPGEQLGKGQCWAPGTVGFCMVPALGEGT